MISNYNDTLIYDSKNEFIRSVKHEYNDYLNIVKDNFINDFIDEYRRVMELCLNELWNKTYYYEVKNKSFHFNLKRRIFNGGIPKYLNTSKFNCLKHYKGFLSGRILSGMLTQLASILNGNYKSSKAMKTRFERPSVKYVNPMIPPNHINIVENNNQDSVFKYYMVLINFTNKRNQNITVPIKTHEMDDHYNALGEQMNAIYLTKTSLNLLYKMKGDKNSNKTIVIGADMGIRKICTLSDGQITPNTNSQNITFNDLTKKLKRKKRNSKAYKRVINEIKMFTNEVVNKLDISNVKELRLESNKGIKISTKNSNSHWQTSVIQDKLKRKCQNNHVDLVLTLPTFKSQRCSKCGFVHKNNRNGEKFECLRCFHKDDADHNSAVNNSLNLPYTDLWSFHKYNRSSGFFWRESGISVL